jgi:hypothetical protein
MKIKKLMQDVLGGALGVVGMIVSLVRGGKEGAAPGDLPARGNGPGRKKTPVATGGTKEAEAKHPAVFKKKRAGKPVTARKATPAPATGKGGAVAQATRAEQAAAAIPSKGGNKAVAGKGAKR